MASIFSAARDAIYPLVETHFAVSTIFNVQTAERVNIRFLIEQAEQSVATISLATPYAVTAWGSADPADWACNAEEYEQEVAIYLITSTRNGANPITDRTLLTSLEDKAVALTNALRDHNTSFITTSTSIDLAHTNEGNSFFLLNNLPLACIVVRARILVGVAVN